MKLINDDCLLAMKKMTDDSVALTITSPPYNMNLRIRNGKHCSRQIVKEISTKYKNFDDNLLMDDYFEFNKKIIIELLRISSITFYNVQFLTGNKSALYKLIGYFSENIKEFIIWDKVNSQPAIGSNVLNSQFEVLLVLSKKDDAISRKFKQANFNRGTLNNLWSIKRGKKIDGSHGTVFPVELIEKIINNFSNEKDIILDPFMGTGTTGVACKNTDRSFVGIEIDKEYFEITKNRIAEVGL